MVALQGLCTLKLSLSVYTQLSSIDPLDLLWLYALSYKMRGSPLYIGEDPLQLVATNGPSVWLL